MVLDGGCGMRRQVSNLPSASYNSMTSSKSLQFYGPQDAHLQIQGVGLVSPPGSDHISCVEGRLVCWVSLQVFSV